MPIKGVQEYRSNSIGHIGGGTKTNSTNYEVNRHQRHITLRINLESSWKITWIRQKNDPSNQETQPSTGKACRNDCDWFWQILWLWTRSQKEN